MRLPAWLSAFAYPPWPLLFSLAAVGMAVSAWAASGPTALGALCSGGFVRPLTADGWSSVVWLTLAVNPPGRLLADWMLMLLAMMPPLLAAPLMHVWSSSLPRRRAGALACFVAGYLAVWLAVGPLLIGTALVLQAGFGAAGAFVLALLAAGIWSASPWQRRALNAAHQPRRIGLFGWAAWRDSTAYGVVHAGWCVASCWAWMLLPLTAGRWHLAAMALTGLVMLAERLAEPARPRWRAPQPLSSALALRWSLTHG